MERLLCDLTAVAITDAKDLQSLLNQLVFFFEADFNKDSSIIDGDTLKDCANGLSNKNYVHITRGTCTNHDIYKTIP